ncbi:MAG: Rho termination factor N-terminal domain-containing protein, partial [Pseudoxanthomonas sp.]
MSDNTPEAGDAGAPAEKRVRKPRVAKTPASEAPAAAAPAASVPPPAAATAPAPRPESQQPAAVVAQPALSQPQSQGGNLQDGGPPPSSPPAGHAQGNPQGGQQGGQQGNQQGGQQGGEARGGDQNRFQNKNDGGGNNNRRDRFRNRRDRDQQQPRGRNDGLPDDNGANEVFVPRGPAPGVPEGFPQYSLSDLKRMPAQKLLDIAEQLSIHEGVARARKQDVIFALLKVLTRHGEGVAADGVLEILPDGFGFLRAAEASYLAGPDDTYISPSQIRRFNLRTGDHLSGRIRFPKDGERYFALSVVDTINGEPIEASKGKVLFENLTALFPRRRFTLERGNGSSEDISGRIMDLMAPQGKGQRALIVSPPKAGKTILMQQIATAITTNHPDVHMIVLLIDERP